MIVTTGLESCPFCPDGGRPYAFTEVDGYIDDGKDIEYHGSVGCEECGMGIEMWHRDSEIPYEWRTEREPDEVPAGFLKDLIERWNTRAERTCKPIYPNDSDFRENHVARCSECRRPLVEYESGEMANFCHFCGARVVRA